MVTTEEIMYCEEALPLLSLNHVSLHCRYVWHSVRFYEHIHGFVLIKRPSSFDFNGGMCADVELEKRRLQVMGMRYVTAVVEKGGVKVDQVIFHDLDGYMIEICNCDKIPVLPISSGTGCSTCSLPFTKQIRQASNDHDIATGRGSCGGFLENVMTESLSLDMMNFSF